MSETTLRPIYGNLVVLGVNNEGRLWKATRSRSHHTAKWSHFIDVESEIGAQKPPFIDVSNARVNRISRDRTLHICCVDDQGHLWHTLQNGWQWQPYFGDIEGVAGNIGNVLRVSCTEVGYGDLHVCAVTKDGKLWHTIRNQYAFSWQTFIDVEEQAGNRGRFIDVDCSDIGGDLHVCGVTEDGQLWHTIRFEGNNTWQQFGNVERQAGERGHVVAVSCGADYFVPDLHVCAITKDGHLWHTIRRGRQWTWEDFGDVEGLAGERGDFIDVSCDMVDLELHVCAVTDNGRLWHTIRSEALWRWQQFGDVEGPAGERGHFVTVGINGNLGAAPGTAGDPYIR